MSVKISELPVLDTLADNDVLAGVDTSANVTSKVTLSSLKEYIDTNTTYTGGTNIDITNNVVSAPNVYSKTETDNLLSAKESLANKITSISSSSTNVQYPSAKSVYDHVSTTKTQIEETLGDVINETKGELDGDIEQLNNEVEELQSEIDSLSTIYNAFPTESDEDESMTLDGTAEVKFKKFDLKGNTSQDGTPTLDTPVPVNVVSGANSVNIEGINLYNYKNTKTVGEGITTDNDGWITCTIDNSSGTSSKFINYYTYDLNLEANTTYAIITEVKSVTGTGTLYSISTPSSQFSSALAYSFTNLTNNQVNVATKTTVNDLSSTNNVGLRTYIYFSSGQSGSVKFRISVIKDTSVTSSNFIYEPYQGNTYNVDLPVENLLNIASSTENTYLNTSTGGTSSSTTSSTSDYIEIIPNKDYIVSGYGTTNYFKAICYYDSSKTFLSYNSATNSNDTYSITTPNNAKYLRFHYPKANVEVQIEKGSKANSYTPYGTTPIELCKIGNYQDYFYKDSDKWYKYGIVGKFVLDGTELNWNRTDTSDSYSYFYTATLDSQITDLYKTFSDMFVDFGKQMIANSVVSTDTISVGGTQYAKIRLKILTTRLSSNTKEGLNTWLRENKPIIYVSLATPTTTQITYQPLIDQLNLLEKAQSKENQTNISQVNNDLPFIISAEAILSLKNVLDRIELLES